MKQNIFIWSASSGMRLENYLLGLINENKEIVSVVPSTYSNNGDFVNCLTAIVIYK